MSQQAVQKLVANRQLATADQVKAWDEALAELDQQKDAADLKDLHLVFIDQTQNQEVMFGLVHLLEAFDVRPQIEAMLEALPTMVKQAPEWTRVLHYRILNDDAASAVYKDVLAAASGPGAEAARSVLEQIARDEEPPLSTAARAVLGS
jgi:hypothetical protein